MDAILCARNQLKKQGIRLGLDNVDRVIVDTDDPHRPFLRSARSPT